MSTPKSEPRKMKHLDFIQAVVARFSANGFIIKGWSITLTAALFTFAKLDTNIFAILIVCIAIPLLWALDAYYLYLEKSFRALFDAVRALEEEQINFDMTAPPSSRSFKAYQQFLRAWPVSSLYSTILLISAVIIIARLKI